MSTDAITIRALALDELGLIREIDRSERIDARYVQHGSRLELQKGDWSAPPWDAAGEGEHSVAGQHAALERLVREGAIAAGRLRSRAARRGRCRGGAPASRDRAARVPLRHQRPSGRAASAVVWRIVLESTAREAGDTSMVVSATPSLNTVGFYQRRGYEPMAEPLPELFELEPEDVHMRKSL